MNNTGVAIPRVANSGITAKESIMINAPADKVWKAITTPAIIKQYFFGTNARSDWKPGSRLTFTGVWEGKPYNDEGVIIASEKNKLLQYTYWSSRDGVPYT